MVTQMLTQWLAAYSPVCHFQQIRFERAEMKYSQDHLGFLFIRIPNTYPKQTHLGLASFDLSKGHKT